MKWFFLALSFSFLFTKTSFADDPSKFYLRTKDAFNVFIKEFEKLEKNITEFHAFLQDQKYPEKENIKYNLRLTFMPENTAVNAFFFCVEDGKTECKWVGDKPQVPATIVKHSGWYYEHFLKLIVDVLALFQKDPVRSKYFNHMTSLSFKKSSVTEDPQQRSGVIAIRYLDTDKNVLETKRYLCHEQKHGNDPAAPHCH